MLCYTCSIWFSRISIVCSVVRVVPPARGVSMTAIGAGGVFFCMWTFMLTCKSVVCSMDESWYEASVVQCPIPEWIAISEVCSTFIHTPSIPRLFTLTHPADALSDLILVILPLRLLWPVKLPSNQRIMVLSIFSASILVSVVSVIHTSYIIPQATFIGGVTAEMGVSTPPPCLSSLSPFPEFI